LWAIRVGTKKSGKVKWEWFRKGGRHNGRFEIFFPGTLEKRMGLEKLGGEGSGATFEKPLKR